MPGELSADDVSTLPALDHRLVLLRRLLSACVLRSALLLVACAEQRPPAQESAATLTDSGGATDAASNDADTGTPTAQDAYAPGEDFDAQTADDGGAFAFADAAASDAQRDAGSVNSASRLSLVEPERWTLLDAADDPFDDRPSAVDCLAGGVMAETLSDERVLGIQTGWCNYLTAQQPTSRALAVGDVLKVRLWHFELFAPEPAEAHAVLLVAGLSVLDERIAIPQAGGLIVRQLRVDRAIPAGAPVYFHLHNHGENSWALVEVSAGPGEIARVDGDAAVP